MSSSRNSRHTPFGHLEPARENPQAQVGLAGVLADELVQTSGQRVAARLALVDEVCHLRGELFDPEGLGDEFVGAHLHRLDREIDRTQPGHNLNEGSRPQFFDRLQHLQAANGLHEHVEHDKIETVTGEDLQRLGATVARATTYAEDVRRDAPELDGALHVRFGHEVRSVVDVPFANGVLTVVRYVPAGFSWRDIEMLRELAENLPALLHRLEDLRQLELRDRLVERAQRLELTGQLAAGTVHEVNNALTAMLGHCDLLLMDEVNPSTRESLELILRAGDSARLMVGHLLTLARGQEPERQVTDMNVLVQDALQLLRRQLAHEGVDLAEFLDPHLPLVPVQSTQIQQIVLNLVQNSRDAVLARAKAGRIEVHTYFVDGRVCLSIRDDGPGVPRKLREKIFEPFFTTKKKGKGAGLGLTVCRTIATSHGGDLRIDDVDQGSCFVLELPAADAGLMRALK